MPFLATQMAGSVDKLAVGWQVVVLSTVVALLMLLFADLLRAAMWMWLRLATYVINRSATSVANGFGVAVGSFHALGSVTNFRKGEVLHCEQLLLYIAAP